MLGLHKPHTPPSNAKLSIWKTKKKTPLFFQGNDRRFLTNFELAE